MKTWQEEVRGIQPWPGARVIVLDCSYIYIGEGLIADEDGVGEPLDGLLPWIDLADHDTRSAFDRRLALRLGAPPKAVEEGAVTLSLDTDGCWNVSVLSWRYFETRLPVMLWQRSLFLGHDVNDPLLARALAWKSVTP